MTDAPENIRLISENGQSCNWLESVSRGKTFGEKLEEMIKRFNRDEDVRLAATRGWLRVKHFANQYGITVAGNIKANDSAVRKVLSVCMEFAPEDEVKERYTSLAIFGSRYPEDKLGSAIGNILGTYSFGYYRNGNQDVPTTCGADILIDAYGLSGLEEIVREYFQVGVTAFPSFTSLFNVLYISDLHLRNGAALRMAPQMANLAKRTFNLRDFKHYLWYQSVFQGYANEIDNFMHSWADSLRMQEQVYGKLKEKYPDNLASFEKKLSYKYAQIKQKIDEEKWDQMVKMMELLEYKGRTYSIICPKTAADVLDEAQQQSNCVASYVSRIINGECMILFCRRTDSPETSLVTVEITADGRLGQVKARFNRAPSSDVQLFIDKWYNKTVLTSGIWPQAA